MMGGNVKDRDLKKRKSSIESYSSRMFFKEGKAVAVSLHGRGSGHMWSGEKRGGLL